ncbi:MAG: M56 family metallopeptidase [Symploca sp. SIO3C6]|nr:M56 family metallopeptidase [Symploca sp. SIO3C6]
MHLLMILAGLGLAYLLRSSRIQQSGNWTQRWQRALLLFLFPPLLLMMTAVAVLCMGPQGQMIGLYTGWFSYCIVLGYLAVALFVGIKLAFEAWQSIEQIRAYPQVEIEGSKVRLLDHAIPFSGMIGFWQQELVITQGLLEKLQPEQLQAVLSHEQAHHYYRDTFWFFWLGWVYRCSAWLPNTASLWEELLLLREIRADGWAAQKVDSLVLAESLLIVVSQSMIVSETVCAAFSRAVPRNRLQQRIDALLAEPESPTESNSWAWSWVLLSLIPLISVPFHT